MTNNKNDQKVIKQKNGLYIQDVSQELKRVTWPTGDVVTKASILVIIIMCISTVYVGGLDVVFSKLFYVLKGMRG